MNYNYIKFVYIPLCFNIILYYITLCYIILYYIMPYYIILHYILQLTSILLLIYNLFKDSNGKVKLERPRLWQLDNSWRKCCERD